MLGNIGDTVEILKDINDRLSETVDLLKGMVEEFHNNYEKRMFPEQAFLFTFIENVVRLQDLRGRANTAIQYAIIVKLGEIIKGLK